MKQHNKTVVPRNKHLNDALINLGHKRHVDERQKKLDIDKQKKQWKDELEEYYE
jgi:hypothetical protein